MIYDFGTTLKFIALFHKNIIKNSFDIAINYTGSTATLASGGFYLFANSTPVRVAGSVVDADALAVFAGRPEALAKARGQIILTPHSGEIGRLLGVSSAEVERDRAEEEAAAKPPAPARNPNLPPTGSGVPGQQS